MHQHSTFVCLSKVRNSAGKFRNESEADLFILLLQYLTCWHEFFIISLWYNFYVLLSPCVFEFKVDFEVFTWFHSSTVWLFSDLHHEPCSWTQCKKHWVTLLSVKGRMWIVDNSCWHMKCIFLKVSVLLLHLLQRLEVISSQDLLRQNICQLKRDDYTMVNTLPHHTITAMKAKNTSKTYSKCLN